MNALLSYDNPATIATSGMKENNAIVAGGGPGILLSYTPTTEYESDAYSL